MSKRSQPGMMGGFTGVPVECSTGPGTPIPTPTSSWRSRPDDANRSLGGRERPVQHRLGAVRDQDAPRFADEDVAGEIGQRHHAVGSAQVGRNDDAGQGVEPDARGRAAPGRDVVAGRCDQSGRHEAVDPDRHGGAGQAGELGELRAGAGNPVTEDRQKPRRIRCDEGGQANAVRHVRH